MDITLDTMATRKFVECSCNSDIPPRSVLTFCIRRWHLNSLLISVIFHAFLIQNVNSFTSNSIEFYTQTDNTVRLDYSTDKEERRHREDLVRKEVLGLLGLHHAPKPLYNAKHLSAPQFMLELYKHMEYDDVDQGYSAARHHDVTKFNITSQLVGNEAVSSDMIVSFLNHAPPEASSHELLLAFASREVPAIEQVTLAELRVYKSPTPVHTECTWRLERVIGTGSDGLRLTETVSTATVTSQTEGWVALNVTLVTAEWLAMSSDNLTLLLTATDNHGQKVPLTTAGLDPQQKQEDAQAFMVAFLSARPIRLQQRQRRAVPSNERRGSQQREKRKNSRRYDSPNRISQRSRTMASCHREAFFVRFSELEWQDWVIAPEGYAAYYCTGKCTFPLNARMNATNHAIVQTLVSLMRPNHVPLPCCAPTTLNHISVLYLDDESNVILKKFQNMVVTACGCH